MIKAMLFPGHGIGPEIATSMEEVFRAVDVPIQWKNFHYVNIKAVSVPALLT
jgi:isocitrate dehydrogenase (NAD+)